MSQRPVTPPAEFDIIAFDLQMRTWIEEGHADQDILSQAAYQWPALPQSFIATSLRHLKIDQHKQQLKPIEPLRDLYIIHRKRSKQIRMVEAKLNVENAPASLHTLYRGLLRDQEASCYKILALTRQDEQPKPKSEPAKAPVEVRQPEAKPDKTNRSNAQSILQSLSVIVCITTSCFASMKAFTAPQFSNTPLLHFASQPSILQHPTNGVTGADSYAETMLFPATVTSLPDHADSLQRLAAVPWTRAQRHRPGNGTVA